MKYRNVYVIRGSRPRYMAYGTSKRSLVKKRERQYKWRRKNPETWRAIEQRARRRQYLAVREALFAIYGHACSCCGEKNKGFLTLDHVMNDGHLERRGQKTGIPVYRRAIRENDPKRWQILCWNCNCGRAKNGGICPHISYDEPAPPPRLTWHENPRKEKCKRGHPFTKQNTYEWKSEQTGRVQRICRTCRYARNKAFQKKLRRQRKAKK